MFAFELGREYRLSIAELYALFPRMEIIYCDEKILLVDNINEDGLTEIAPKIGGTIKIIKINTSNVIPAKAGIYKKDSNNLIDPRVKHEDDNIVTKFESQSNIFDYLKNYFTDEKKTNYAINFYGKTKANQKDFLLKSKKHFAKLGLSTRFVNQDFQNIKSYLVAKEKLIETKTDINILFTPLDTFIGNTIFVQDIDSYAKRDFGKTRDMQVGMLPPKLAQMMINIATQDCHPELVSGSGKGKKSFNDSGINPEGQNLNTTHYALNTIYDPFCGLGTILLECIIAGNKEIYGSDISDEMIKTTKENINFIKDEFNNELKISEVIKLDARDIANSPILKNHNISAIVTEGYLGEIFGKQSIDIDKIKKQRQSLSEIYNSFFAGLKKIGFSGNIVISFPFWELKGKYNYFEEIYEIINKYCNTLDLLPKDIDFKPSKSGSLLYKRPEQTVGREIFKLKIK